MVTFGVLFPRPAVAQSTTPTFVQGTAFSTPRFSTITVTLSRPVAQGDLLVGWVSQYNAPEEIQVADNVNGTWTRAPAALTFGDDTGDIEGQRCGRPGPGTVDVVCYLNLLGGVVLGNPPNEQIPLGDRAAERHGDRREPRGRERRSL